MGKNFLFWLYCRLPSLIILMLEHQVKTFQCLDMQKFRLKPDIAKIIFSVSETRSNVVSAQKYTSRIVENTLKLLSRMQIDEESISTTGTSVNPVYHWNSTKERQELIEYRVKREIRLELNDLSKLGKLIEEVGKLGITNITSPRF